MTSYRLTNDELASFEQAGADVPADRVEDAEESGRLPWRVAGPLLFCVCALAWTALFLVF
jgi:hypothetical protein